MIRFECPQCHKGFQVEDKFGGRKTKCPKCGAGISIPIPQSHDRPSLAPPLPNAPPSGLVGAPAPYPSEPFSTSPRLEPPSSSQSGVVGLTIEFAGASMFGDPKATVRLDKTDLGVGSLKRGFHFDVRTTVEPHALAVAAGGWLGDEVQYLIEPPANGDYTVILSYSRFGGIFYQADLIEKGSGRVVQRLKPSKTPIVTAQIDVRHLAPNGFIENWH